MVKLKDLEALYARLLGKDQASIHVLAMMLRKQRLIRSSGRGLNAAEMATSDATNLLLASVGGGAPTKAAETVRKVRTMQCIVVLDHSTRTKEHQLYDSSALKELRDWVDALPTNNQPLKKIYFPKELRDLPLTKDLGQALDALLEMQIAGKANPIEALTFDFKGPEIIARLNIKERRKRWLLVFFAPPLKHPTTWFISRHIVSGELFQNVADVLGDRKSVDTIVSADAPLIANPTEGET